MRMPSFTAELSLYDNGGRYRHALNRATDVTRRNILPQYEVDYVTDDGCWEMDCFYDDDTGAWQYCDIYGPYC